MLLGASSDAAEIESDASAVMVESGRKSGIDSGDELLEFTTAVHRLDDTLGAAREALIQAVGTDGMIDAAVTAAIFRSLNIAADTSGIRVDDDWEGVARGLMESIGTGRFRTAANSPAVATG